MDPTPGSWTGTFLPIPLAAEAHWAEGLASLLFCVVVVVALAFLAAMVEAAYLTYPTTRAKSFEHDPNALVRMAARLRLDFAKPLATMVIVNNATNIAGSALTAFVASEYFEARGIVEPALNTVMALFTAVLTLVIILLGEIVPKTIGESHSHSVTKWGAYPVRWLMVVLAPVVWLTGHAQKPFQRVGPHATTEEEIAQLATIGQEQGAIEEREEDMIHRVLKLNDIAAEQIMTPRVEMIALQADRTLAHAAEDLGRISRSLVPLYRKNRDDVVGILDRSDALVALARGKGELPLTDPSISRKPFYVPSTMPADELLVKLQRRTEHMAIVVGEYGDTLGLVTIEDVLEEIVGEIYDESDLGGGSGIQRVAPDELLCLGAVEVKDVNEALGAEIPNHRSVAGLMLDELERIPQKGEVLEVHGVRFAVEEANDRAILKVRVKKLPPPPAEGGEAESAEA